MDFLNVVTPWTSLCRVCVRVRVPARLSGWMALCCSSPMWPSHSGCTRLRPVCCTSTPAEVWSASSSKGTRQNHTHTHTPLVDRPQLAVTHTRAVDRPSPGSPVSSLGGISESAEVHLWQVTLRFSHLSLTPLFTLRLELQRIGVCVCVTFLIFVTLRWRYQVVILWRQVCFCAC